MKNPFWDKVMFTDFIAHFRSLTPKQRNEDIEASMKALETLSSTGDSFGAMMVRNAKARSDSLAATASRANGKKGGRPPMKCQLPRTKQEVIEFAIDHNLDPDDASTWAEQNLKERKGKDKFGNRIENWKGALINYCKSETAKRSA